MNAPTPHPPPRPRSVFQLAHAKPVGLCYQQRLQRSAGEKDLSEETLLRFIAVSPSRVPKRRQEIKKTGKIRGKEADSYGEFPPSQLPDILKHSPNHFVKTPRRTPQHCVDYREMLWPGCSGWGRPKDSGESGTNCLSTHPPYPPAFPCRRKPVVQKRRRSQRPKSTFEHQMSENAAHFLRATLPLQMSAGSGKYIICAATLLHRSGQSSATGGMEGESAGGGEAFPDTTETTVAVMTARSQCVSAFLLASTDLWADGRGREAGDAWGRE
ncbi:hypothetical protein DPEC_G00242680 [Dallia pectoralis]|uniref:Uncharacterized protein n=1 Tax=Dallia pectoralis TaxID=75939 RepID=A0ACC2FV32_DALPE|nr:hypothetical protein DPEC_G00242680 [Dallia pectoralis]